MVGLATLGIEETGRHEYWQSVPNGPQLRQAVRAVSYTLGGAGDAQRGAAASPAFLCSTAGVVLDTSDDVRACYQG